MEVQTTIAPKRLGYFTSKRTKGDSYTVSEPARTGARTTGPENEVESLVDFINSVELEADREIQNEEKDIETAKKLGKFVLKNKSKIVDLLEGDLAIGVIRHAIEELENPSENQKIVALKQAHVKMARKRVNNLRRNGRLLLRCMGMSPELQDAINKFLNTLEFQLLGGDLEQIKEAPRGALKLSTNVQLSGNQVNNIFIISEGGLYETQQLTPSIQKEFMEAQAAYNLTERTHDMPPKICKTPPSENLSPFLPTPVVLFHTDLLLEFALAQFFDTFTAPRHPKSFDKFGTPPDNFTSDKYFMDQRLVGVNPCGITKMTPETKALFTAAGVNIPSDTNNCYVWDYRILDEFASENLPSSVLLAHYDTTTQEFKPLAVWAKPGPGNTVTPTVIKREDGGNAWEFGKMCLRVSEWSVHELGSHLTLCHFVCEMFDVITHHCLPKQHPVFQLLLPHIFRTIPLNDDARATLLPKVIAGNLSAMTTAQGLRFCSLMIEKFDFKQNYVPGDLDRRGVMGFPDDVYPFKVTALKTWTKIRTYVANALALVASMADNGGTGRTIVDTDMLVRGWVRMMRKNFTNFPDLEGADNTNDALYDALTLCIYTASHQHAAVNYFQAKYMSFLPASPGHLTSWPANYKNLTEAQLMQLFPSYQTGILQRSMVKMLSTHPESKFTLLNFKRTRETPRFETNFSVEWQQLDNELQILQAGLKNTLVAYSDTSVSQKTLAQSVLI